MTEQTDEFFAALPARVRTAYDGPHSPATVADAADAAHAAAELVRYLANATQYRHTLPHAGDVYELLSELQAAAGRLPQVLRQIGGRMQAMTADRGQPAPEIEIARYHLAEAELRLTKALDLAQSTVSHLGHHAADGGDVR